jgi:hypothetical protein
MCRGPGLRCLPERVGLNEGLGRTVGKPIGCVYANALAEPMELREC